MNQRVHLLFLTTYAAATLLLMFVMTVHTSAAFEVPELPYIVLVNAQDGKGNPLSDGTVLEAKIDGVIVARANVTSTVDWTGIAVLQIPANDSESTERTGGHAGDTILFVSDHYTAEQTSIWQAGVYETLTLQLPVPLAITIASLSVDAPTMHFYGISMLTLSIGVISYWILRLRFLHAIRVKAIQHAIVQHDSDNDINTHGEI